MDATKQSQDLLEVTASMRTALLVYGGINVKMMVDSDLGAQLATMFMVHYDPDGATGPHDHPFEETYYFLEGRAEATFDGKPAVLVPGTSPGPEWGARTRFVTSEGARSGGWRPKLRSPRGVLVSICSRLGLLTGGTRMTTILVVRALQALAWRSHDGTPVKVGRSLWPGATVRARSPWPWKSVATRAASLWTWPSRSSRGRSRGHRCS